MGGGLDRALADDASKARDPKSSSQHKREAEAERAAKAEALAQASEAAAKALASYENIFWIAGGQFKEESLDVLVGALSTVRHAYLIGDAQDKLADGLDGKVPLTRSGDLKSSCVLGVAHFRFWFLSILE